MTIGLYHKITNGCISMSLSVSKVWCKKIGHVFCSADQEISLLVLKWITKGQINLFQALKWGIVRLCSSNIFGDTSINVKILFLQFLEFCKIWRIFLAKSWKLEIIAFLCLVIVMRVLVKIFRNKFHVFWGTVTNPPYNEFIVGGVGQSLSPTPPTMNSL